MQRTALVLPPRRQCSRIRPAPDNELKPSQQKAATEPSCSQVVTRKPPSLLTGPDIERVSHEAGTVRGNTLRALSAKACRESRQRCSERGFERCSVRGSTAENQRRLTAEQQWAPTELA